MFSCYRLLHGPCHRINFSQVSSNLLSFCTKWYTFQGQRYNWPINKVFLDALENELDGSVKCNAIKKLLAIKVYYITSPQYDVLLNKVMSPRITLSKQISDDKLASDWPHPMDLCAQFVKSLAKGIGGAYSEHGYVPIWFEVISFNKYKWKIDQELHPR